MGKGFFINAYMQGRKYTIIPRIMGNASKHRRDMSKADQVQDVLRMEVPRYANTKASAMYPTVSNAKPVPLLDSSEMFIKQ